MVITNVILHKIAFVIAGRGHRSVLQDDRGNIIVFTAARVPQAKPERLSHCSASLIRDRFLADCHDVAADGNKSRFNAVLPRNAVRRAACKSLGDSSEINGLTLTPQHRGMRLRIEQNIAVIDQSQPAGDLLAVRDKNAAACDPPNLRHRRDGYVKNAV